MKIRQATVEDAAQLIEYLATFRADGCDTVSHRSSIPTLRQEREWLTKRNGEDAIVFVAEQDGRIAGMIDAAVPQAAEYGHTCEFGMSVLLQFRKQGIGGSLIEHLLNWTQEKGILIVGLNVYSTNTPAISLYSRMGFCEDGRIKNGVKLRSGQFCDLVHMSKHNND